MLPGIPKKLMEQMEKFRTVQAGSKRLLKRGGGEVWRRGLPYAFRIYAEKKYKKLVDLYAGKAFAEDFIISLISLTSFPIPTVFTADRCVPNRICRAWSMSSGCCMHAG